MSLAFAAPAALLLGLLALGPILAHIVRRLPETRRAFGAMLLLQRLARRTERRRRIHDRLLLALRVLALLALLLALARPELRLPAGDPSIGGSGRVVVVLDDSLSMDQRDGGGSAFAEAQTQAAALVRGLGEGVQVAVVTTTPSTGRGAPAWSSDSAVVAAQIEAAAQRSAAGSLDDALTAARTLLEGKPGEVVIYTDGSGPGGVAGAQASIERLLATGSAILPRPVGRGMGNLVVSEAEYGDGLEGGTVSITVRNHGPSPAEVPATVRLPDGAQMTAFVTVPGATEAGPGEASAAVTVPRQAAGGVASVTLVDPWLPLDDTRFFHLPQIGKSRVLVVDGDPGSSPTRSEVYFLERALAPVGGSGAALDVVSPAGLGRLAEGRWRVAILANVGDPTALAPALGDFVRGGGALVLTVGDNVSAPVWNAALTALLPAPLGRERDLVSLSAEEGMALEPPGAGLELFAPFETFGRAGFARVRTRRVFSVEGYADSAELRTLLRYESGVPALIERTVGEGKVLLFTSTADLGWSNFALQSVYAPFWHRLVAWLGGSVGANASREEGVVGETVRVTVAAGAEVEVRGPTGERVGSARGPGVVSFVPEAPGAYEVGPPGEPAATWVAVNTPAPESDVRPDESIAVATARIDPDHVRRKVPLDAWLGALALMALLAAGALGRRAPQAEEAA